MAKHKDKDRDQSIRRAKHERRENARRARQDQRRQQQQQDQLSPPKVSFTSDFGAATLQNCGPQLFCTWALPRADVDALQKAGRAVPQPVNGALLLDTGATRTCIALQTAIDLGLQPRRMQDGFGAGGAHKNPVFLARLDIRITNPKTNITHGFSWEQEVEGIPELHKFAAPLAWQNQTTKVTGLLGRDILRHARIHYDGPAGIMRFEFDVASIQGKPSR